MYNTISLFSGAMGLDLGLEKAGFDIKVCVEMNKWACETIRNNTKIPVIEKDINLVSSDIILKTAGLKKEDVFLVVGGPPCQAFSSAGKQRGLADFRGNVIVQYLRVISDIQPKYFILENVRGLLSAKLNVVPDEFSEYEYLKDDEGSVLYFLIQEFQKSGYTLSFALFNAVNYGVPQARERMIIFGHKGSERIPLPSPTHTENGEFDTNKWLCLGDVISDLENDNAPCLPLRENTRMYMSILKEGENWRNLPPELAEKAMGKAYHLGGGKTGFLRRLSYSKPSPTLVTSPTMPATLLCHPTQLRPLSTKEYARIQQFPDEWKITGNVVDIYKQIGNAVPVGLGYMAGNQILKFDRGEIDPEEECCNKIPYSRYKNTTDKEFEKVFEFRLKKHTDPINKQSINIIEPMLNFKF